MELVLFNILQYILQHLTGMLANAIREIGATTKTALFDDKHNYSSYFLFKKKIHFFLYFSV